MSDEEWLIYYSPTLGLVKMLAKDYDQWEKTTATPKMLSLYPVLTRGLTLELARAMIGLTKEQDHDDEI